MTPKELKTMRVLVVGAGVTGLSVMRYLQRHDIPFAVADAKHTAPSTLAEFSQATRYVAGLESVAPEQYDVMVLSPGIPRAHPMLVAAIASGVKVIGDVELFAAVVDGDVIAITGSNGKSTVASMAAHVLARSGKNVKLCGNIGTAALDVLPSIAQSDADNDPIYVLELSSYHQDTKAHFHLAKHKRGVYLTAHKHLVLPMDELSVPGIHNAANALAVLALLQPFALPVDVLAEGLSTFSGLEHRTELIVLRRGVRWFNDSKGTNVDACIKAITAMPGPVVLIAGGQGKGVDFSPLRSSVSARVKALILMGEDAAVLQHALEGAAAIHSASSMAAAVQLADSLACSGDVVLLSPACASFDMFDNYMARGNAFRESVEQLAA